MADDFFDPNDTIADGLPAPAATGAVPVNRPGRPKKEKAENEKPREGQTVVFPPAPYDTAIQFCKLRYVSADGSLQLLHHRGEFFEHDGAAFCAIDDNTIKKLLYEWLASCWQHNDEGKLVKVLPHARMIGAMMDALRAACHIRTEVEPPVWLQANQFSAKHLICCRNGYLHWPDGTFIAPSPALFAVNAVSFAYFPHAPAPRVWLDFLNSVWADDAPSIDLLQEWFGYCLTDDCSQQKIAVLKGPRRSGKTTIARALEAVIGKRNVCNPTLNSLSGEFGLEPLIGKKAAIIGDARLSNRSDIGVITERLLSISGEDGININRKNRSHWIGALRTRITILTNELPRLSDTSSALPGRFLFLVLTESFYGKEDRSLFDRIKVELPGIMNWALAGLRRLEQRGHFVPPKASEETAETMERLSSPMLSFLRDVYQRDGQTLCDEFSQHFRNWSRDNGREISMSSELIGSMLRDVVPSVTRQRLRTGPNGTRQYWYVGVQPRQS